MLEVNFLRQNKEEAIQLLKLRKEHGFFSEIEQVLSLDELRKKMQTQLSDLQRDSKKTAEEIGLLLKTGKKAPSTDANRVIMITTSLKQVERLDKPNCMLYKCRIQSYLSEISIVG